MNATDPLDSLRGVVGASHVLTGELTAGYVVDWTRRWRGQCAAVVRPADTAEVAAVVRICAGANVAVVTQGGNTGLVGGAVPEAGAIVLSTARLDDVGSVDDLSGQLTAGAGATLAAVQRSARDAGWRYPVDLAARDTATVGGTIATNAGGHHVVRHGMTRRHVVGVEAVLADGSVISHLGGLVKDNTGYDLAGLLCGSEGTLGVVTRARLSLVAAIDEVAVALVAFDSIETAVGAVGRLRRHLPEVEALELVFEDGLVAVGEVLGATPPVLGPAVVLVEAVGGPDPATALGDAVAELDGVIDAAVADDRVRREELWRWRDHHTETIARLGASPPHKLDVTVNIRSLPEFVHRVREVVARDAPEARLWLFGHVGDGNLHVNVTGLPPDDHTVDLAVAELVASLEGSISAEHGIGRAKRHLLGLTRSEAEIRTMRSVKEALDPQGILNPGVLIP